MENLNEQKHNRSSETPDDKDKKNDSAENNAQTSPDTGKDSSPAEKKSSDQQSAQQVKQAIKDDPALSAVAGDIHVTVKDGAVTLNGQVSTEQQMNLATNTAAAVGMVDEVNNQDLNLKKVPDELKGLPHETPIHPSSAK